MWCHLLAVFDRSARGVSVKSFYKGVLLIHEVVNYAKFNDHFHLHLVVQRCYYFQGGTL